MKYRVFWDVVPCCHEVDRRFRGILMMAAVRTSKTSVHFYLTTRSYMPENSKLHSCSKLQQFMQKINVVKKIIIELLLYRVYH
jgi:hypothetical protein